VENHRALRNVSTPVDQVCRRREFEAAHPGIAIRHTADPWEWTALWPGHPRVVRRELRDLLDQLEVLAADDEERH
jgi:hypothetical protein